MNTGKIPESFTFSLFPTAKLLLAAPLSLLHSLSAVPEHPGGFSIITPRDRRKEYSKIKKKWDPLPLPRSTSAPGNPSKR